MFAKPRLYATVYALTAKAHAKQIATNLKDEAIAHQSELTCVVATTVVVGLAARVVGFRAGYAFAQTA